MASTVKKPKFLNGIRHTRTGFWIPFMYPVSRIFNIVRVDISLARNGPGFVGVVVHEKDARDVHCGKGVRRLRKKRSRRHPQNHLCFSHVGPLSETLFFHNTREPGHTT